MNNVEASMVELDKVWKTINQHFKVMEHDSCGTHIHVGTGNDWSLEDVKKIAKGWCWFETEITEAMPESRKNCDWARPNCSITYEPQYEAANEMTRLYKNAMDFHSSTPLFEYIDDATSVDELINRTIPERSLSWNLQNLRNKCQTVEFRRPPRSANVKECKHWITFTLSIIRWAISADCFDESGLENSRKFKATLYHHAESMGISENLDFVPFEKQAGYQSLSPYEKLSTLKKKTEKVGERRISINGLRTHYGLH